MDVYNNSSIKKNYIHMKQAILFAPKKSGTNINNEKKDIENKVIQNINEVEVLNNNINYHKNGYDDDNVRKNANFITSTLKKGKDTILTFNTKSPRISNNNNDNTGNNNNNSNSKHISTVNSNCMINPMNNDYNCVQMKNNNSDNYDISRLSSRVGTDIYNGVATRGLFDGLSYGLINKSNSNQTRSSTCASESCNNSNNNITSVNNVSSHISNVINKSLTNENRVSVEGNENGVIPNNNLSQSSIINMNFFPKNGIINNNMNGHINSENNLEYLSISSKYFTENKKDIVYLLQELLSYCECLKRSRKKSTEEINKIRISYNKVSELLKETLKREKNSHIKIEELRNIINAYDEKFNRVKNCSEGTITNLNKNVQTLVDLNNDLEMEMNKVINENQQLRKIAQNEFELNKEINDLRKQIELLNNENISLVNQIDVLRLENSKIENEKNVLLSDKTLLHCKIDELENGLKNRTSLFSQSNITNQENNPFIINSDEEINEQVDNYLNLNHDQRTELFKNFLYHWRETNKAGQKFYEQAFSMNQ
ncbi:conserved Plasmodium protein, unknown function [Plasmodium berghei]|uniref:Uncharacterized protein n=2 Tax=Plasmodium berghei TaxID=5821 RepID=A0A509AEJ1_PLABA|nr:conserved Plasmodium protein, unknown function [Plasmodium berghei ANKA]CXH85710.1 conserved Plasmodium protein, unknown function [Plasmodium berghei]SCL89894.1 conserved Plasmodium protein, unknown function [Plasmodium berghei]SCM15174.1 conserved Plasmodium protein, unknown function [Plasmodium berghei]SCM16969.1 conserved Plasmodium protein, unknown function [Plasmodium berghei]SCN21783.1 conserved Plasmodium protein, unknown function [Plasmodium berghei]|eukprot:XP_034419750.1 conserved Plasmodium protein, unknown function [Plasmodium berghei ANKA]